MDDEEALLRAIALEPDDIPLRLVYADWLEEQGEARYAAFIRHQCAMDGILQPHPAGFTFLDARYLRLEQIDPKLVPCVLKPFQSFLDEIGVRSEEGHSPYGPLQVSIRRGLVERIILVERNTLLRFIPHIPTVFARLPIRSLTVLSQRLRTNPSANTLGAPHLSALLAAEGMSRLEELDLSGLNLGRKCVACLLNLKSMPWKTLRLDVSISLISPAQRQQMQNQFSQIQFVDHRTIPF